MGEMAIFLVMAVLITACSFKVATSRNPVTAAVFLVIDLFLIAGTYALQNAHFTAAIQIIVYAGAIIVVFLFVIMLLNLSPDELDSKPHKAPEYLVMVIATLTFAGIAIAVAATSPIVALAPPEKVPAIGNTEAVGIELFSRYAWPFELASVLILLAIIASVLIAKQDKAKPVKKAKS